MISSLHAKRIPRHQNTGPDMKNLLVPFAAYNHWANQKLLETILALPEERHQQEVPGSFPSLYKTVLHTWDAESVWWQRIKLHERIIVPSENFNGTMRDISNGLLQQNQQWIEWVNHSTEAALEHVFQYYSNKRELFKQPVWQVVLHVFNHGTYHRGQLVNILRQLGVEKIPQTDYIVFSRLRRP